MKPRSRTLLWMVGLPLAAFSQNIPRVEPIPRDALELATGRIQVADAAADRDVDLKLLTRARNSYALRNSRQPWDLTVHFTVDSLGQTNYDGEWEMEDVFAPGQGLHWTAKSAGGYTITGIIGANANYVEASTSAVPLRLQEARAMLYDPLPSVAYAKNGSIRTVTADFRGSTVVCVLLARSRNATNPAGERGWDESEDCIDPDSGLLQMHSEVPGRYVVYDYANSARLGSHVLPGTVTITEGGRVVSRISVTSLRADPAVDPGLFVPTNVMMASGPGVAMTAATKIARIQGAGPLAPGMTMRPVCVLGIVTPAGRLEEAHSLQPSDPNSEAAVQDAESIDFSPSIRPGSPPQQHFAFVIEKFLSMQ